MTSARAPLTAVQDPDRLGAVPVPEDPDVLVLFTDRSRGNLSLVVGGGDAVAARGAALAEIGARLDDAVFMEQVHGGRVARVDPGDRGRGTTDHADAIAGTDGLVTDAAGVALAVLTADCVPLVLVDPGNAFAGVHAGRRGVEARVAAAAVDALDAADRSRVVALVGPAVGGCCYEVDDAAREAVAAATPVAATRTTWGTPSLDLPAAVARQLADSGVERVRRVGGCTRCGHDRWFSHRATTDPVVAAPAGRQAALMVRRPTSRSPRRPSLES